jgi:putative membrane-bound dehydrogenase-like protein
MRKSLSAASLLLLSLFFFGFSVHKAFFGDPEDEKRKPENAVKNLRTAEGLQTQLFASEPMMTNPTDMDIDDRGRIWLCEAFNYRPDINGNPTKKEGDRILIIEDTDHDGKADKSTVFYQGPEIESPLGIWVMGNKALVSQSPYLWLFTDDDGDDKADRKEIVLQGVGGHQHDHGLHAVTFGPDGKWYFNFGNEGHTLQDKNGVTITDIDGKPVDPKNYRMGMVFRCDPDFTHFEVLGHNFRNNYEVACDSYGTLWQSDNDDDGNKGVRINYVMEYGNYGYTDEMTGAGWQVNRTNIEPEIPHRHWHLNDPGVVPNLLQTGAGSPCGMCVYEGDLLPARFTGQPVHADAGPNAVRAYPVQPDGAGYKAQIDNILEGVNDQWFRPSDVCVAPDGSLFVSDWYDPGVGGHQAGDQNRGRVFRVAPPSAAQYTVPAFDYTAVKGAVKALQNPNLSVRYKAWNALHDQGAAATAALSDLYNSSTLPHIRARALWLLAKGPDGAKYVEAASVDKNANIRIVAIRAARQGAAPLMPLLAKLCTDPDPQVRRECAIALHHNKEKKMPDVWTKLAQQYTTGDRWYLEALGIGADGQWDACFYAWARESTSQTTAAENDIIWRARCAPAATMLGQLCADASKPLSERLRYFRAFDFQKAADASPVLLKVLRANGSDPAIVQLALRHLDMELVKNTPDAKAALTRVMAALTGDEYLEFADKYQLTEENERLFNMVVAGDHAARASEVLLKNAAGRTMYKKAIQPQQKDAVLSPLLDAIRGSGGSAQLQLIESVALDKKRQDNIRRQATECIGNSWNGEERILELLKAGKIEARFIPAAVQGVSHAWRTNVRMEAATYLGKSNPRATKPIPAIADLLLLKGDPAKGVVLFDQFCANCHQVNGKGVDFGPKLSAIGGKLPKEGQYLAILYPNAGISFGYEGWDLTLQNGDKFSGLITSQTEHELVVKGLDGSLKTFRQKDMLSRKQRLESMMPAGFQYSMTAQELADLVEYLMALK